MPKAHTSRDFETELRELRAHSLAMGARCERSLHLALEAFWKGVEGPLTEVLALDAQIDRDEMDIDALVLRILALRQPVAYDLRFLATALKLVTDLERIGDEAVNIAERAAEPTGDAKDTRARASSSAMAAQAQEMLRNALDALRRERRRRGQNACSSKTTRSTSCTASSCNKMSEHMTNQPEDMPAGLRVIKVAKYIERVADHATNIAEEVIFMVRGEDVRHVRKRSEPLG